MAMSSQKATELALGFAVTNHSPSFKKYFEAIDGARMPAKGKDTTEVYTQMCEGYAVRYRKAIKDFLVTNCKGVMGLEAAKKLWEFHVLKLYVNAGGAPSCGAPSATTAATGAVAGGGGDEVDVSSSSAELRSTKAALQATQNQLAQLMAMMSVRDGQPPQPMEFSRPASPSRSRRIASPVHSRRGGDSPVSRRGGGGSPVHSRRGGDEGGDESFYMPMPRRG